MRSYSQSMFLQVFFFENIQNREACRAGYGIPSKRAEKFHAVVERFGDLCSCDYRCERESIANRLAKNDDVRNHALRFESPEMRAEPPKSDLYFIRDAHSACTTDMAISLCKVASWKHDLSAD